MVTSRAMRRAFALGILSGGLLGLVGCGSADGCEQRLTCPGPDDSDSGAGGGSGGAGGGATGGSGGVSGSGTGGDAGPTDAQPPDAQPEAPAPCDETLSPAEDSCVISDSVGVFVSPTGSDDTGDGTQAAPYATLAKAIEEATIQSKRVYVCADGEFSEDLTIDAPLEIFGGFDCTTWAWEDATRATLRSPSTTALRVEDATGVEITNLAIHSADAADPGESSAGVFAVNSTVALTNSLVSAGKGADGADGTVNTVTFPDKATLSGNPAGAPAAGNGGAAKACSCPIGPDSSGGGGGNAQLGGQGGGVGGPDLGGGTAGVANQACNSGGGGGDGAAGRDGLPGPGPDSDGALSPTSGFVPADGNPGSRGGPGQGGGGGRSDDAGAGGGGGCGGCPGAGALPGRGAGASAAIVAIDSSVTVSGGELRSGDGGKGGAGLAGQPGQPEGGAGGLQEVGGCSGGAGGPGGDGAASGGGGGGHSVGALWTGTAPTLAGDPTLTFGTAGIGGDGGLPASRGRDGLVAESLELPKQ